MAFCPAESQQMISPDPQVATKNPSAQTLHQINWVIVLGISLLSFRVNS